MLGFLHLHILHTDPALVNFHFALTPAQTCLGVRDSVYSI